LPEQYGALILHLLIGNRISGKDAETFEEWFIGKDTLEGWAGILEESVENGKSAELAMNTAVFAKKKKV
jgi:hypothetical protein